MTWIDERAAEIRQRATPGDEDSLWVVLFDDPCGDPLLAFVVDGAMAEMDGLMTRNLAMIIDDVPAKAALLAVCRRGGAPAEADRQLWRDLLVHLCDASTELLDLIVVGDESLWSARADRVGCRVA